MPLFTFIMENISVLNQYIVGTCACNPPKTIVAPSIEDFVRCLTSNILQNTKYKKMNAGAISKLLYGFYVCTGDNPLAKASGLSSRTHAQTHTITYTNLISLC